MAVELRARRELNSAAAVPVLAASTVLAQILYPLLHNGARDRLSEAIVILFAAASVSHAASCCRWRVASGLVILAGGLGFAAEAVGVHTGYPFGHYTYSDTLGPQVRSVPVVVALAWVMFAWPATVVARRLATSLAARTVIGAGALASWDLFLDPQMVAAGHWQWSFPAPHLPGVDTVPLTNYAGWLGVSLVISLALQLLLRHQEPLPDLIPLALFGWTYLSSILALGGFLHLSAAAGWGALGMGPLVAALAVRVRPEIGRRPAGGP